MVSRTRSSTRSTTTTAPTAPRPGIPAARIGTTAMPTASRSGTWCTIHDSSPRRAASGSAWRRSGREAAALRPPDRSQHAVELGHRRLDRLHRAGELEEHRALGAGDDRPEQLVVGFLALRLHVGATGGEERAVQLDARDRKPVNRLGGALRRAGILELPDPAVDVVLDAPALVGAEVEDRALAGCGA